MKSEGMDMYTFQGDANEIMFAPSLVDLCVQTAIDNVRYIGDVGETDLHLLACILPHCTLEQLKHIEDSTEGRDLSPVTDKLWKKFYEIRFTAKSTKAVVDRMKEKNVTFNWRLLYEAKAKDVEELQEKSFERIKQLYKKEDARKFSIIGIDRPAVAFVPGKQSRRVQPCTKVPPSSNKRSFGGGWGPCSSIGNSKSSLMKKSKVDFLKSQEVKNLTAMKRNAVQKSSSPVCIRKPPVCIRKPGGPSAKGTASISQGIKPSQRNY